MIHKDEDEDEDEGEDKDNFLCPKKGGVGWES